MNATTKDQIKSAFLILQAVAESIKELKQVPSGHLYAMLIGMMDLATYERIIDQLKLSQLVKEDAFHRLIWIGPA